MSLVKSIIGFFFWILISLSAGFIGSQYMPGEWYAQIAKPSWNPPNYIFAPVWTTLYILMGISAWLVWKSKGFANAKFALTIFIFQLIFNALWSYAFFGLHNPFLAFIDIIILWCLIALTLISFWKHSTVAGALFIPYLLWVTFASVLNYTIYRINP